MSRWSSNIYKIARKSALLTQEQAAELLHLSTRSIIDYETDKTRPSDEMVCNMVDLYDSKWLAYMHMKSTAIGKRYLPNIKLSGLPTSVLRLQKEVEDVRKINNDMISIVCDEEVENFEKSQWSCVEKELSEMIGAGLGILFYDKKRPFQNPF
ncbi:MAG: helix-turn-helix transcriptional regulator [Alkaliphilus sp.]